LIEVTVEAKPEVREAAERALARLAELAVDLRAAAILGDDGTVLATTGPGNEWAEQSLELIGSARDAVGGVVDRLHIGTTDGEVFALPEHGRWCVAITERFTLASLLIFDLRVVLREMARELGEA
jgi:photosystem II stability/assembly factor-like uncharacterized protein